MSLSSSINMLDFPSSELVGQYYTPSRDADVSLEQMEGLFSTETLAVLQSQISAGWPAHTPDFEMPDVLALPTFSLDKIADASPLELSAPLLADNAALPSFDIPALTQLSSFVPSTSLEFNPITKRPITYQNSLNTGNVLLCLPRRIRQRIYSLLLADYPEFYTIEVPDIGDFAKTFPPFIHTLDIIYFDACLLLIQNATFTISSSSAIFNLMALLREFTAEKGYKAVRSLDFSGDRGVSALKMFKKGAFSSNAVRLLTRCSNVTHVSITFDLDELPWTYERGGREVDFGSLIYKYDILSVLALPELEVITLSLKPTMALEKRIKTMEEERIAHMLRGWMGAGADGLWGLKEWFLILADGQRKMIEVRCPSFGQLV